MSNKTTSTYVNGNSKKSKEAAYIAMPQLNPSRASSSKSNIPKGNDQEKEQNQEQQEPLISKTAVYGSNVATPASQNHRTTNFSRNISIPNNPNRIIGNSTTSQFKDDLVQSGALVRRKDIDETTLKKLGGGHYADVFSCKMGSGSGDGSGTGSGTIVACKKLKQFTNQQMEGFILESQILLNFGEMGENSILEIIGVYLPNKEDMNMVSPDEDNEENEHDDLATKRQRRLRLIETRNFFSTPIMVTSFYENSDIEQFLKNPENKDKLTTKLTLSWGRDLADALIFLSKKNIVHRDIAARNVMLDQNLNAKLIDFGLAREIGKNGSLEDATYITKHHEIRLPMPYLALECLQNQTFSHESDIWAFGICIWEIFTFCKHKRIYEKEIPEWGYHEDKWGLLSRKLEEGTRLDRPKNLNKKFYKEIKRCWHRNPHERITAQELKNHFSSALSDPYIYNMPVNLNPDNETLQERSNNSGVRQTYKSIRNFQKNNKKLSWCLLCVIVGLVSLVVGMGAVIFKTMSKEEGSSGTEDMVVPSLVPVSSTEESVTKSIFIDDEEEIEEKEEELPGKDILPPSSITTEEEDDNQEQNTFEVLEVPELSDENEEDDNNKIITPPIDSKPEIQKETTPVEEEVITPESNGPTLIIGDQKINSISEEIVVPEVTEVSNVTVPTVPYTALEDETGQDLEESNVNVRKRR